MSEFEGINDIEMKCPNCSNGVAVDSIRKHRDGRERIYWECKECNLSIMIRNKDNLK